MLSTRRAASRPKVQFYLSLRFVLTFGPWVLHLVVANIILSALLPLTYLAPVLTYRVASAVAGSVWRGIQHIFVKSNGANITIAGDDLPAGESAIVVANHVEWCDFYLIQALAIRASMLGHCRWFAKKQLQWVPLLGWGLKVMGMPLVGRKWTEDKLEMDRLFHGVKKGTWPMWLISYSEGTRYSKNKYAEAVQWCQKNEKPIPKHTLYPRTKGFISTVQHLRQSPHVKGVYDVTIAYADDKQFMTSPSFFQSLYEPNLGQRYRLYVYVRRFELSSLPHTDAELAEWLEERWMEKGERLEMLKKQLVDGSPWRNDKSAI